MRGWGLGMRLYCDRECSDKLLFVYTLVKYATLHHIEPCGVTTYQYSKDVISQTAMAAAWKASCTAEWYCIFTMQADITTALSRQAVW